MAERSLSIVEQGTGGLVEDGVRLLGAAARNWRLVLLSLAICLTTAVVYVARKAVAYQATARLLIVQRGQGPLARPQDAAGGDAGADSIPTQALIIRSPLIVGRALEGPGLRSLGVGAVAGGLAVSRPDPTAKILQLSYTAGDAETAKAVVGGVLRSYETFLEENYHEKHGDAARLLSKARDELNEELKSLEQDYLELHRLSAGGDDGEAAQARRIALWDQAAGEARLRSIRLREQLKLGQALAREGADLWAVVHAMGQVDAGGVAAVQGGGEAGRSGTAGELAQLKLRRAAAEKALEEASERLRAPGRASSSIQAQADRLLAADPDFVEMQDRLEAARNRHADTKRRARNPSDIATRGAADRVAALEAARDDLADRLRSEIVRKLSEGAFDDPEVARIRSELASIRARESVARERLAAMDEELLRKLRKAEADLVERGPADAPGLASLRARIARVERGDAEASPDEAAVQELLAANERSLASVESMQAEIQKQFAKGVDESKRSEIDRLALDNARNNLDRQRQLYNTVVDQLRHVQIQDDFRGVSAQVIDPPAVSPLRPNAALILSVAGAVGLAIGLGLAAASEKFDPRLHSVEDIRRVVDLPMLGVIPRLPASLPAVEGNLGLIGLRMPRSPMAEVLRIVRTGLEHRRRNSLPKVVLVTSPAPGDGKTVTASNLAISLSETGRRVLAIDADMRCPRFHAMYGTDRGPGLAQALEGKAELLDVVRPTPIAGVDIVTAGEETPRPADLLSSRRFREFLDEARRAYDVIVIDSPPLLAVADASIIGAEVDGILLVVRASTLRLHEAVRTMEVLESIGAPPLGMVVNRPEGRDDRRVYGAYFGYGEPEASGRDPRRPQALEDRDLVRKSG